MEDPSKSLTNEGASDSRNSVHDCEAEALAPGGEPSLGDGSGRSAANVPVTDIALSRDELFSLAVARLAEDMLDAYERSVSSGLGRGRETAKG